jgi:hypothetical protein
MAFGFEAELRAEIERLRLTDAEREAVEEAASFYGGDEADGRCQTIAATLRGLLSRTGSEQSNAVAATPPAWANVAE